MMMERRAEVLNKILEKRGADFRVKFTKTRKNNIEFNGYTLISTKYNTVPTIYRGAWYDLSDEEVCNFLEEMFAKHSSTINVNEFLNKEYILDNVLPRLVGINESNKIMVTEKCCVHQVIEDMYKLFYIPVIIKEGTLTLTKQLCESCDITEFELIKAANDNLEKEDNSICVSMKEIAETANFPVPENEIDDLMTVITNKSNLFGAGSIFSKRIKKILEEKYGEKYVLLPSSIHEMIAMPYPNNPYELDFYRYMVMDVNHSGDISVDVQLTNSVYAVENGKLRQI